MVGALLGNVLGTVDSNLSGALDDVTSYFGDNIGVVIAAFIGIAVFIWLLALALRSVGVKKPSKVG